MSELKHPYTPSPQDLVAVEVVWPDKAGVREDGKVWHKGQTLNLLRGHAENQNRPGRPPVYRILKTVRYANGPEDQAEQTMPSGPLVIS